MAVPSEYRAHRDWQRNYEAGRASFLAGHRDRLAVRKAYVRTASRDGHLIVRALAWRSGYAEAAAEAQATSYQIGVLLALVG